MSLCLTGAWLAALVMALLGHIYPAIWTVGAVLALAVALLVRMFLEA